MSRRSPYNGHSLRRQSRLALPPLLLIALAGCGSVSLTVGALGEGEEPAATGSLAQAVEVRQPLPPTLAYSDAALIGRAAMAAVDAAASAERDWVNAETGSSGTLALVAAAPTPADAACRQFGTTVTSLGGVHQYSGTICRRPDGRPVVETIAAGAGDGA